MMASVEKWCNTASAHVWIRTALFGLLYHVVLAQNSLRILCDNDVTTQLRIHILCERLRQGDVRDWYGLSLIDKSRFSKDTTSTHLRPNHPAPSNYIQQDNQPGMFYGIRVRRGGNYIRFGRSAESYPYALGYMGGHRGRYSRGDGHYVRFGRSAQEPITNVDQSTDDALSALETDPLDPDKRFMRFGKRSELPEGSDYKKRFMRFGKRLDDLIPEKKDNDNDGKDGGRQFMRWGKSYPDNYLGIPLFGSWIEKRNDENGEESKRFMRFGRGGADDDDINDKGGKRFMRFGKRDGFELENLDKRFMRFGKRGGGNSPDADETNKRFMRFGKRENDVTEPIHIVKRSADPVQNDVTYKQEYPGTQLRFPTELLHSVDLMKDELKLEQLSNKDKYSAPQLSPLPDRTQQMSLNEHTQLSPLHEHVQLSPLNEHTPLNERKQDGEDESKEKKFMRFGKREGVRDEYERKALDFKQAAELVKLLEKHFNGSEKRQNEVVQRSIESHVM